MSETKNLLQRISSFRERLEKTPSLISSNGTVLPQDPNAVMKMAQEAARQPEWIAHSLKQLSAGTALAKEEPAVPTNLLPIARKLLEEIRLLTNDQRTITQDLFYMRLVAESSTGPVDPLVAYHRATITATESLIRMTQTLPTEAEPQQRVCAGIQTLLGSLRDRQALATRTMEMRRREWGRIERITRLLVDSHARRVVSFASFAEIAEELIDEVKMGIPLRFLTCTVNPVPRFIATKALTVAQVVARMVPHDFEWSTQPILPVAAALMMDVGMLGVPGTVLESTNELSAADRRVLERHALASAEILREIMPELGSMIDAIGMHHENLNGTGYPFGRKGDAIPTLARLLRVADSYASRCTDRIHRSAYDPRVALTDLLIDAEQGQYDKDFTEYLLNFSFHPVGTTVELTDGRVGVVAGIHTNKLNLRAPGRPIVAILADAEGKLLPKAEIVDLMTSEFGAVVRALSTDERRKLFAEIHPDLC